jgi:antitoxin component HigA of HigAB toxin-antitoxin module
MKPKIIKTEAEYQATLARIEKIFNSRPGTAKGDELELLLFLVETYEDQAYPIDPPDPVVALLFRMEQQGAQAQGLDSIHRQQEQGLGSPERTAALEPDDDPQARKGFALPSRGCSTEVEIPAAAAHRQSTIFSALSSDRYALGVARVDETIP